MVKAILFDVDGTLRDSREAIYLALEQTLRDFELPVPSRELMNGNINHVEAFFEHFTPHEDIAQLSAHFRQVCMMLADKVVAYEHVLETLQASKAAGMQLGAVSSSTQAKQSLQAEHIDALLDVIIDGLDTKNRKPHPEPVLLALQKIGVKPSEAIMVGDLPADIEAGKAAGVALTIALTHGFGSREALLATHPDYVLDSFSELLPIIKTLQQQ